MNIVTLTDQEREAARAARVTGVFCRLTHTSILEVRGADTARYLEAMCTKDLSGLDPGGLRYSALLDDRGRLVADFWIWRAGESWWLEVEDAAAEPLLERLNRFAVADEVEVVWRDDLVLVHAEGPRAGAVVSVFLDDDLTPEAAGATVRRYVMGWARRSRFGEEGFTLACASSAPSGWVAVRSAGLVEASAAVQESLRIEAGRARFGIDFSDHDLLPEVGIWGALSLDKGCFPGQEIVRRVISRGEVKRRLVGFVEDASVPGAPVLEATSITESVALGRRVGLGWLKTSEARPEARVSVQGPLFGGQVAALPFVSGPHAAAPDVPGERVENTASR